MSMKERNQLQMRFAAVFAARHGLDLLEALSRIAVPFAALYPSTGA